MFALYKNICKCNEEKSLQLLRDSREDGIDITDFIDFGEGVFTSMLEVMAPRGNLPAVCFLLEEGAGRQQQQLVDAIKDSVRSGQVEVLHYLLKWCKEQKLPSRISLHWCFECRDDAKAMAMAAILLQHGATVEEMKYGKNVILEAAGRGVSVDFMRMLLTARGSNLLQQKNDWREIEQTPLHAAAAAGKVELVKLLVEHHADVEVRNKSRQTVLHVAVGNCEVVEYLIEKGVDVNALDEEMHSPLCTCLHSSTSPFKTIRLLINKGANCCHSCVCEQYGPWTRCKGLASILRRAVLRADVDIVETVIMAGGDPLETNAEGKTLLHSHADQRYPQQGSKKFQRMTKLLVDRKIDVNAQDCGGCTALHYYAREARLEEAALLLKRGAYVDAKRSDGWTALLEAAKDGKRDVMKLLLENGADVNARVEGGHNANRTALSFIAETGSVPMGRLLLQYQAELEAAMMETALRSRNDSVAALLVERGAVALFDGSQAQGETALHYAVKYGARQTVRAILKYNRACIDDVVRGETALGVAVRLGLVDVAHVLIQSGAQVNLAPQGTSVLFLSLGLRQSPFFHLLIQEGAIFTDQEVARTLPGRCVDKISTLVKLREENREAEEWAADSLRYYYAVRYAVAALPFVKCTTSYNRLQPAIPLPPELLVHICIFLAEGLLNTAQIDRMCATSLLAERYGKLDYNVIDYIVRGEKPDLGIAKRTRSQRKRKMGGMGS